MSDAISYRDFTECVSLAPNESETGSANVERIT